MRFLMALIPLLFAGCGTAFQPHSSPENATPMALAQTVEVDENGQKALVLSGSDRDGDTLTVAISALPTHGSLSGPDASGNAIYIPTAGYTGQDAFTFTVADGRHTSAPATVSITVLPINHPPLPRTIPAQHLNQGATIEVALDATDPDGDAVTYSLPLPPRYGTAVLLDGGVLRYTASPDHAGTETIAYQIDDGHTWAMGSIDMQVNATPVAGPVAVTVAEDSAATIQLTASDADEDILTFAIVTTPAHGSVDQSGLDDGVVIYRPDPDYFGPDLFTWSAHDQSTAGYGTVNITVVPVDDAPRAGWIEVTLRRGRNLAIDLRVNDPDQDLLIASLTQVPVIGQVQIIGTTAVYTPPNGFTGADHFLFTVSDATRTSSPGFCQILVEAAADDDPYLISGATRLATAGPVASRTQTDAPAGPAQATLHADGILFLSRAANLGLDPGQGQVLISHAPASGSTRTLALLAQGDRVGFAVGADGDRVVLANPGSGLAGDPGRLNVYLAETDSNGKTWWSPLGLTPLGAWPNGTCHSPVCEAGVDRVAFLSDASDLVSGDTNQKTDLFLCRLGTGTLQRVNLGPAGAQANADAADPALSPDGRYLAFASAATNLVTGDDNGVADIFLADLDGDPEAVPPVSPGLIRLSAADDGTPANGACAEPTLSYSGHSVAFSSTATTLVPETTAGHRHVYLWRRGQPLRCLTPAGDGDSRQPRLDYTGTHVVFASSATNLVPDDTNGVTDIFVSSVTDGSLRRLSVNEDGMQADGPCRDPAISPDGKWALFTSVLVGNLWPYQDLVHANVFRVRIPPIAAQ